MFSHALTLSRSRALLLLLLISCSSRVKVSDDTLSKSVEWMWAQQSEDGGWHSKTHAVLRDGKVLTPYILFHLTKDSANYDHQTSGIKRSLEFIRKEMWNTINDSSLLITDYPNYSAAYALRVLHRWQTDTLLQRKIAAYLIAQQFDEDRGFSPDSLVYGGWGYGEPGLPFGMHGHVDISHTRRVAEALKETDFLTKEIKDKATLFIEGVQRYPEDTRLYEGCKSRADLPYDGGFIASVVTMSTIKSEPVLLEKAGYHYPSYATATCDGFMTLHALGLDNSPQYADAANWLKQNQNMRTIDGLSPDDPEQWDEVMHYYHFAVRAEAMSMIDPDGSWKKEMEKILINEQTTEGYYINPIGGVNKEDDPLMATIFCIQVLKVISTQ